MQKSLVVNKVSLNKQINKFLCFSISGFSILLDSSSAFLFIIPVLL